MGKTTVAELIVGRGIPVIDTDELARRVVEPGEPALEEIRSAFGPAMLDSEGRLRRAELADRVFSDPGARRTLESIVHPRIRKLWLDQAQRWRDDRKPIGVVVIPLLFETDAAGHFDATVCVACSAATQEKRLRDRGWTRQQIEQRRSAQWSIEEKMAAADFVLWTEGTFDVYPGQLDRILALCLALQLRRYRR